MHQHKTANQTTIQTLVDYSTVNFHAMASPCELLIESQNADLVQKLADICVTEVRRIEKKYSRYHQQSLCSIINQSDGSPVPIDDETFRLLQFAHTCYLQSEGLFDITSGVLGQVWHFNGGDQIPTQDKISPLLPLINFERVHFDKESIVLPKGMALDFGGIGKEYAVSRLASLCLEHAPQISVLVNLGGDLQITLPRQNHKPWMVGIDQSEKTIPLKQGALATSGDANRYLLKNGVRYSHILNPKTGWPIQDAPHSITILAPLCIQAGCLATLSLLQGANAEAFLNTQEVKYWSQRSTLDSNNTNVNTP